MAFLKSPIVHLTTEQIKTQAFFQDMTEWTLAVNPDYNNPPSKIESITFHKKQNSPFPFAFFSYINFDFNQLDGAEIIMLTSARHKQGASF